MKYKYNYFPLLLLRPLPIHVMLIECLLCVRNQVLGTEGWLRHQPDLGEVPLGWRAGRAQTHRRGQAPK